MNCHQPWVSSQHWTITIQMIVWVPGDDKWRHFRDFIENLHVFPSCHLHQLPKGSESWVCKLICPLMCYLGNWEDLAGLSRTSSHVRNIATAAKVPPWEHRHISWCLRKHGNPPCFLGVALLEGLKGLKTLGLLLSADLALMHLCEQTAFSCLCCLL